MSHFLNVMLNVNMLSAVILNFIMLSVMGPNKSLGPEVGLWNTSSCLGAALGATKLITVIGMNSVALCCAT